MLEYYAFPQYLKTFTYSLVTTALLQVTKLGDNMSKKVEFLVHFTEEMSPEERKKYALEQLCNECIDFFGHRIKVPDKEVLDTLGMKLVENGSAGPVYDVSGAPPAAREIFIRQFNKKGGYARIGELRFIPVSGLNNSYKL
jgi:hypothetical protein